MKQENVDVEILKEILSQKENKPWNAEIFELCRKVNGDNTTTPEEKGRRFIQGLIKINEVYKSADLEAYIRTEKGSIEEYPEAALVGYLKSIEQMKDPANKSGFESIEKLCANLRSDLGKSSMSLARLHDNITSDRTARPRRPDRSTRAASSATASSHAYGSGARQPRADRRVRGRRRRGGDRAARDGVALEQVPEPGARRRGAADPEPERLQDREPDHPRAHQPRRAGGAVRRLRLQAVLRRGQRSRT